MFEQSGKMLKLINASMEAYFGDLSVSVWYKQYQISIEVFRLFREKVGVKIIVSEDGKNIYICENENAGIWNKDNKWLLCQSTITRLIDNAIENCK